MIQMIRQKTELNYAVRDTYNKFTHLADIRSSLLSHDESALIFAEQYILGRYLLFLDGTNPEYLTFIKDVNTNAMSFLSNVEKTRTTQFLHSLLTSQISVASYYQEIMVPYLRDAKSSVLQFTKEFYEPFIYAFSGISFTMDFVNEESVYLNSVLLKPVKYTMRDQIYIHMNYETFPAFHTDSLVRDYSIEPGVMGYLMRFDWTGKNFGEVLVTLGELAINKDESNLFSVIKRGLFFTETYPIAGYNTLIDKTLSWVKKLQGIYHMPFYDLVRVGEWLTHYDAYIPSSTIRYMSGSPADRLLANRAIVNEWEHSPLKFLDKYLDGQYSLKTIYGKEAAGDEANPTEEEEPTVEDDPTETEDLPTATDTTGEGDDPFGGDDLGSDDLGTDDAFGDDSGFSDDSSSSSDGKIGSIGDKTETDDNTQPIDPAELDLKISVESPSSALVMYRVRTENQLKKFIKNAPEDTKMLTIDRLKAWLTQWLWLATAETTEQFLKALSIKDKSFVWKVKS